MPAVTLKALLSARSGNLPVLTAMFAAMGGNVSISDTSDRVLLGDLSSTKAVRVPIAFEDTALGYVSGPDGAAHAIALLLARMTAKESESKALGSEVLHLYREMHLIEQLSEQLSALLDSCDGWVHSGDGDCGCAAGRGCFVRGCMRVDARFALCCFRARAWRG